MSIELTYDITLSYESFLCFVNYIMENIIKFIISHVLNMDNVTILLSVGRLVVVIDVNPSHWFWTTRLMKVFGHEGQCT
jgi:hypothetical protein